MLLTMACLVSVATAEKTVYVSKLGDGSDGQSWSTAFRTVQEGLNAVPDAKGGHRVVVRPDTYMEANLFPAHPGAENAYNLLVGDVDGALGSGTSGSVIIDSGDPQKGFKSYDWWGTVKSYKKEWSPEHTDPTFSAIGWDRWRLSHLYVTGGDGGFMFDCVDRIEPFTVIVEDCVSIGRAFGGGVASCLSRPQEPILFRRCHLWALDWWGDTSAAYVRIENDVMPEQPDVLFEDCTLVSPQCALKVGNYGFKTFSHVKVNRCKLIALNFSQPHGTPTEGTIQSVEEGRYLKIDLEDSTLMGFKVFGCSVNKETAKDIQYTTQGSVLGYVQFTQEMPEGIHRIGHWPADVFQQLVPPAPKTKKNILAKEEWVRKDLCELSPFVWQGNLCHMECIRPGRGGSVQDYTLRIVNQDGGKELSRFAEGYGLASVHVHEGEMYVFASQWIDGNWNHVTLFHSKDLKEWKKKQVIEQEPSEHLFNSSVCQADGQFIMAYESNDPKYTPFTVKFARSKDLKNWTQIEEALLGSDRYAACPCIRYANGFYYVLYLERRSPRHFFETYLARSSNLKEWELSPANPVLSPDLLDEGINTSDPELVEFQGKTFLYYAVGDQLTWMNIKRAAFLGPQDEFFASWFEMPGIPTQ